MDEKKMLLVYEQFFLNSFKVIIYLEMRKI